MKQHEELKTMTPSEQMDSIVAKTQKFEMCNCLISLLAQECGLPKDSELSQIMRKCVEVYQDYYRAMEEFKDLRNENQGRTGKEIQRK